MKRNNKKGFTIVELAIVIAVIAILAAVLIPTFTVIVNNAKETAALANCKTAYDQAIVAAITDNDPDNDTLEGYVFVSDGYAYQVEDGVLTLQATVPTTSEFTDYKYDAAANTYVAVTFDKAEISSSITVLMPATEVTTTP